jgi:hypothetical protein
VHLAACLSRRCIGGYFWFPADDYSFVCVGCSNPLHSIQTKELNHMSRKSDDAALLAAFLSTKKAQQIPAGERTTTERQVWLANRGIKPATPIETNRNAEIIRVVTDHLGREFYTNEEGEYL